MNSDKLRTALEVFDGPDEMSGWMITNGAIRMLQWADDRGDLKDSAE